MSRTALVGLGRHQHRRVGQRAPAHHQQLEHGVEGRRVRAALGDRGQHALHLVARAGPPRGADSRARIQLTLPSSVLNSPLWALMWNGCASAQLGKVLVEKRECTMASALANRGVGQVGVEARELGRREHSLVDHGARGEAGQVQVVAGRELDQRGASRTAGARASSPSVVRPAGTKQLADHRAGLARRSPACASSTGTSRQPTAAEPSAATLCLDQVARSPRGAPRRAAGSTSATPYRAGRRQRRSQPPRAGTRRVAA